MERSVVRYMEEVGRYPLLSREEEIRAFRDLAEGRPGTRERIAQSNLRFVVKIALAYRGRGLSLGDLIQEGNIGLLEVIDRFDVERGFRFSTYAAFWIRQAIQHALRSKVALVRIPSRKARKMDSLRGRVEESRLNSGREPEVEELADELDMSAGQIEDLLNLKEWVIELDAPFEPEGLTKLERMADPNIVDVEKTILERETRELMNGALHILSARERLVVELRYGLEDGISRSLREVSRIVELSQEGVRRIERRAFDKLRLSESTQPLTQCA